MACNHCYHTVLLSVSYFHQYLREILLKFNIMQNIDKDKFQFEFKRFDFIDLKKGESRFLADLTKFSKDFSDSEQLKEYVKMLFKL